MEQKNNLIFASFILAVALIIVAFIVSSAVYHIKALAYGLSVTGSAEKIVTSDTAKWTSSFSRNVGLTNITTGSSEMKSDLATILAYFNKNGIPSSTITIEPMTTNSVYDNSFGKPGYYGGGGSLIGYSFQQQITVESNNIKAITALAQKAATDLTEAGVIFSSQPVQYYYSKLSDLRVALLAAATQNAKDRAEQIVKSVGSVLGPLRSASQGVFQITPVNSAEFSGYGFYDTSAIEKKVTAIVNVSFGLK
ncbi:MAG: SIMPL domain-containing protein [Patescibacteria group bacterium]|nr:SIMPL domain-containing protein [Patescibacteria group bacterium]